MCKFCKQQAQQFSDFFEIKGKYEFCYWVPFLALFFHHRAYFCPIHSTCNQACNRFYRSVNLVHVRLDELGLHKRRRDSRPH